MKKDKINYYENFRKSFNYGLEASKLLKELVDNFDRSKIKEYKMKIHALEVSSDRSQYDIYKYLIEDFLPPIEREDILDLTEKIDVLVDNIDDIIINIDMLNVDDLTDEISKFSELLCKCCEGTSKILQAFGTKKKYETIKEDIILVNKLEGEGDTLYQNSMKTLYTENYENVLEIIKFTRLYDEFEECYDSCEGVANCINNILLKNI